MDGLTRNQLGKRVVFMTPLHRGGDSSPNNVGATLVQYVDAIIAKAEKYSLPVIDTYRMSGLSVYVYEARVAYINDYIHPNVDGHVILAKNIAGQLAAL
jgi:lysophospholipase L1-like esterase